jgi:excisionase family DNA binding protein
MKDRRRVPAARLLTVAQAAEELALAQITLRTWLSQGRVGYCRLGRAIRIPSDEIERLIWAGTVSVGDCHGRTHRGAV